MIAPDLIAEQTLVEVSRLQRAAWERMESTMEKTRFEVIPSPTRAPGYSIKAVGKIPSWSPTGVFGWYRYKADALARARVLNAAEIAREKSAKS